MFSLPEIHLPVSLPVILLGGGVAYFSYRVVYALFFHPLARAGVPGPWYAAIGDHWNEWEQMRLVQSRSIAKLMKKYGPVVRIGENRVAYVDEDATKVIYGPSSKFTKDAYYKRFVTGGNDHAMTLLPHQDWQNRRKAIAAHYGTAALANYEADVAKYTHQLLDGLQADGGKTAYDLMSVFRHLLVDVVFATGFDLHNGTVDKWSRKVVDPLDLAVTDFPKRTLLVGIVPGFLIPLLAIVPNERARAFYHSDSILKNAAERVYYRFTTDAEALKADNASQGRKSLIQRMIEYRLPNGQPLARHEVCGEAQAHLIAGSETTATTASMMIWELTRHPEILAKLREELDEAIPEGEVGNWNTLFTLPYFNAFIKEGLRLYAVIPGPLPRVVGPEYTETGLNIGGYNIPPGVCVGTQAWSVHRQPDVYPDPLEYKPERWFNETERMRANYMPFGVGPRICVGQNLGQTMLRVLVSTVVRYFTPRPAPETNAATMDIYESFALFPKGLQAKFNLVPREEKA